MSLLAELGPIVVDARMIYNSGIGVVLRELLHTWEQRSIPPLYLLGNPEEIRQCLPGGLRAEIIPWHKSVYSPAGVGLRPKLPSEAAAWFSPHYATCLRPGIPLVCQIHDTLHVTHPPRRGTAPFMKVCLGRLRRRAAFIVTPSRHTKVQLQTLHGFDPHRVLTAPQGPGPAARVSPDSYRRPGETPDGEFLLAVGILKPHKNWPFLFERLQQQPDGRLPLVCAGLGKDRDALRQLAASYGLRNIYVPDYLEPEELAWLFARARALVHPSLAEGYGLPILEAMAFGTPVVHANVSPMKEIAGDSGFPFDPEWPESFDEALECALAADGPGAPNGGKARALAARYSWPTTASIVEEALYRAVTGELPPQTA